jgi:hypothetical protein
VAVVRVQGNELRFAQRDSFAGTILADAGVRQVRTAGAADVLLVSQGRRAQLHVDGAFEQDEVDVALWWGPGGVYAARAALADLKRILQ